MIGSASWEKERWQLRTGAWAHTADHEQLETGDISSSNNNYGGFMLAGYKVAPHAWTLRLGAANPEVSRVAGFAGLGYQYKQDNLALGVGAAHIFHSADDPVQNSRDTTQLELYLRYRLAKGLFLTGDVQRIENSNFDASGDLHDAKLTVYGLRATWLVE